MHEYEKNLTLLLGYISGIIDLFLSDIIDKEQLEETADFLDWIFNEEGQEPIEQKLNEVCKVLKSFLDLANGAGDKPNFNFDEINKN